MIEKWYEAPSGSTLALARLPGQNAATMPANASGSTSRSASATLTQINLFFLLSAIVSMQRSIHIPVQFTVMNRLTRKLVSLLSIFAMVFAQLAVAAYACPMQFQGLENAMTNASVAEPDAGEFDAVSPALCKKHCDNEQQNVNDAPQAPASFSFETALTLAIAVQPVTTQVAPAAPPSLHHATSPPHAIRNCCFRI